MTRRVAAASLMILILVVGSYPGLIVASGDEPQVITGPYETTNPIYPLIGADTGAILFDLSGQIAGDYNFTSPVDTQVLGALEGDITRGTYRLELPASPEGSLISFDGDPDTPPDVQLYASARYIEFIGGAAMDRGETPLDLSVRLDPLSFEIIGGGVIVYATHDGAWFPGGFGPDDAAFTADDPLIALPEGWSVVRLAANGFEIVREPTVDLPLIESLGALNDYSEMDYIDAWGTLFARTRETYPFSDLKDVDWDAIYAAITPAVEASENLLDFHLAIASFGGMIPDMHIGYTSLQVLQGLLLGGVGISALDVTDEGQVIVTGVEPDLPAAQAGIELYDVLLEVDGDPALDVLDETPLLLTSASTPHTRRLLQSATMLQGPLGSEVTLTWQGAGGDSQTATLSRVLDVSSILTAFDTSEPGRPVVYGQMLRSGMGYIRVRGFAEEVSRADDLFAEALRSLVADGAQGIILDVRDNTGGMVNLAMVMAGHFFPDYRRLVDFYYADGEGGFAFRGYIETLPAEPYYDGPVAVLVNEMTGSAGDLFVYTMQLDDRAIVVGNTPTGGYTGEVSDGQYLLPGQLMMQIPTGRPIDPVTGEILIEGTGVPPVIDVPVTVESLESKVDEVLQAAEAALLDAQD